MAFLFSFDFDRPAVGDDQRKRVLVLRADVQEVDAEAVDGGLVLPDGEDEGVMASLGMDFFSVS